MDTLRLTLKLQRWEIALVALACLGLAAAATWMTLDMRAILDRCGTPAATKACDVVFAFQDTHDVAFESIQSLVELLPFVVGLVLGVPIVAREVEQRTALIAWPMTGSRLRWLAWRLVPTLLIGLLLMAVVAISVDQMVRAYFPHGDIGFSRYESRGIPLVMRTVLMLVAGVAIGAVVGRVLPSLLVGIGLSVAVTVGLAVALPHWVPSTALPDMESDPAAFIGGRLHTSVQYRLPTGEVVSADEGEALAGPIYEQAAGGEPDPADLPQMIIYGVSGDRYLEVVSREAGAIGLVSLLLVGLGGAAVQRRRPE